MSLSNVMKEKNLNYYLTYLAAAGCAGFKCMYISDHRFMASDIHYL